MRQRNHCDSAFENCKKPDGNYMTLKIGKVAIDVLVDSGSAHSLTSERVARILKLKIESFKNDTKSQLFCDWHRDCSSRQS